ncbi:MAG: geranylgeranylglyceryl/heptaprenylglyceryl phosphate synthase [Schleiferiaceae bacterium]|nr:geranylgeranylglyceryl/heptaprenylglyceryl phosphate synthase [Schleiferiaceae bacterium]
MSRQVLTSLEKHRAQQAPALAVLVDPDRSDQGQLIHLAENAQKAQADYIFVGGSLLTRDALATCIKTLQQHCSLPVVLFPGSIMQLSPAADALLFLSLISGRNPEYLIGNQVVAAPYLRQMDLEVMPTGYMLIHSGQPTTASYMSGSQPIPWDKPEIASATALAGQMLGLRLIYMDGGSGAQRPISETMIREVRQAIHCPLIIGGGILTPEKVQGNIQAGADVIVVGNALEKDPSLLAEMVKAAHDG